MRWIVAVLLLLVGWRAAVMGGGDAPVVKVPPLQPLPTPIEALRVGYLALATEDEPRALATIRTTSDGQRDLLRANMAYNKAVLQFRDRFVGVYGEKAWQAFQGLSQEPAKEKKPGKDPVKEVSIPLDPIDQKAIEAKLGKAIIEVRAKDGEAFARFPRESKPTKLVKVDGGWVMAFDNFGNAHGDLANQISTLTLRCETGLLQKFDKAIGASYTGKKIAPQDIAYELGRALLLEQTGLVLKTPQKFDIEKLK
jgi:hypothetical protein